MKKIIYLLALLLAIFSTVYTEETDIEEILFVFLESIEKTLKKNYVDKTEEEKRQIYLPNLNNAFKNLFSTFKVPKSIGL